MPEASRNRFAAYHLHYKKKPEIIEYTYNPFLFRSLFKSLSLLGVLSDYIVKFAIHHSNYKDIVGDLNRTFVFTANCLFFLYGWSNLLVTIFGHHGCAYFAKPGLVMKKRELLKTSLHLLSYQPLFLFLSLTFSKMRPVIFKYSPMSKCLAKSKCAAMSKYIAMFKWQPSSTLTSFSLLLTIHRSS